MRRALEQTYPFEPTANSTVQGKVHGLVGAATHLAVTAPALAAEGSAGLYRFDIALDAQTGDLTVRWVADRNGLQSVDAKSRHEVLLSGVQSMSISYLELVELGNGQIEAVWRDSWLDQVSPPALVRVKVTFASGNHRL